MRSVAAMRFFAFFVALWATLIAPSTVICIDADGHAHVEIFSDCGDDHAGLPHEDHLTILTSGSGHTTPEADCSGCTDLSNDIRLAAPRSERRAILSVHLALAAVPPTPAAAVPDKTPDTEPAEPGVSRRSSANAAFVLLRLVV